MGQMRYCTARAAPAKEAPFDDANFPVDVLRLRPLRLREEKDEVKWEREPNCEQFGRGSLGKERYK